MKIGKKKKKTSMSGINIYCKKKDHVENEKKKFPLKIKKIKNQIRLEMCFFPVFKIFVHTLVTKYD